METVIAWMFMGAVVFGLYCLFVNCKKAEKESHRVDEKVIDGPEAEALSDFHCGRASKQDAVGFLQMVRRNRRERAL